MAEANNKDDKYGAGAGALESTSFWAALLRYGPSPQRHAIRSRMSLTPVGIMEITEIFPFFTFFPISFVYLLFFFVVLRHSLARLICFLLCVSS